MRPDGSVVYTAAGSELTNSRKNSSPSIRGSAARGGPRGPPGGGANQPNHHVQSGEKESPHRPQRGGGKGGDPRPRWRGGALRLCPASPPRRGVLPLNAS